MPNGLFNNNFQRDRVLKSGNRGFQAGPTSNLKIIDPEIVMPPIIGRSGKSKTGRRHW